MTRTLQVNVDVIWRDVRLYELEYKYRVWVDATTAILCHRTRLIWRLLAFYFCV